MELPHGPPEPALDFDAFCAATSSRVVGALYAYTGSRADAEDVSQEAFARAWQRWSVVSRHPSPEMWVRQVALRLAQSRARRASVLLRKLRVLGAPPAVSAPSDNHVALVAALQQLPVAQREAVVLHHLVGRTVEEIADECGTPTGTIKARLSRGRTALAALLGEELSPDDNNQPNDSEASHARTR